VYVLNEVSKFCYKLYFVLKNAQHYGINCKSSVNFIGSLFSKCFATPYSRVKKLFNVQTLFYTWSDMPVTLVRCVTYIVKHPVCVYNVNIYNTATFCERVKKYLIFFFKVH
jgi:hypothetical protein